MQNVRNLDSNAGMLGGIQSLTKHTVAILGGSFDSYFLTKHPTTKRINRVRGTVQMLVRQVLTRCSARIQLRWGCRSEDR